MLKSCFNVGLFVLLLTNAAHAGPEWKPQDWEEIPTLQFQTINPDQEEHWSTVWFVFLDGDIYLRLGTTAADYVDSNIKRPYVKVRIRGMVFRDVRADPANSMAVRVADAMAEKYPTDFLIRYMPHPLTVRLRAASF